MLTADYVRCVYDYGYWARDRILTQVSRRDEDASLPAAPVGSDAPRSRGIRVGPQRSRALSGEPGPHRLSRSTPSLSKTVERRRSHVSYASINFARKFGLFNEQWQPKVIAEMRHSSSWKVICGSISVMARSMLRRGRCEGRRAQAPRGKGGQATPHRTARGAQYRARRW